MNLPVKDTWRDWCRRMRQQQIDYSTPQPRPEQDGPATMDAMMTELARTLPEDAMVTFGAGEHTNWAHRYFPTNGYASMISARNGSMGYSVPSAVAASLNFPGRRVISIAGDGEFLMNGQELATAAQYGATPLVIVMDNQEYGTIRTHQERQYPGHVSGTQLKNPDFAAMAAAFHGVGVRVERQSEIPGALEKAYRAIDEDHTLSLIHI